MTNPDDILDLTQQALPGLRRSERSIADIVLAEPEAVERMTITELAARAGVSVATVARFCSAVGTTGFGDFKRRLTAAVTRASTELSRFGLSDTAVSATDTATEVISKVTMHELHAIQATAAAVDVGELEAIVAALIAAPRIDIYGSATSAIAGIDLQQKLLRLALAASHWSDPHLALTSASLLNPGSVALGISHSGLTVETVHAIATAKEAGATTVAITNYPDSPLARTADHVLCTVARETEYRSGAMSGRMAQLALVDFIFVRAAQLHREAVPGSDEARRRLLDAHRLRYDGGGFEQTGDDR
ncbi:MurR/RpiR family transcriptional regulator [Microbacterium soli]